MMREILPQIPMDELLLPPWTWTFDNELHQAVPLPSVTPPLLSPDLLLTPPARWQQVTGTRPHSGFNASAVGWLHRHHNRNDKKPTLGDQARSNLPRSGLSAFARMRI